MKHKIVILLLSVFFSTSALAQNSVAVYVTSNDGISQKIKKVVGSEIVATITSTNEYVAVERTEDFLAQVSQERGNYEIDDATLYNLGRKFGASNVCVVDIIGFNDGYYMVGRLLDIKTSKVWKTARHYSKLSSLIEVLTAAHDIAKTLFVKEIPKEYSSYIIADNVDDRSFINRIENRDSYTLVTLTYLSKDPKQTISINKNTYIEDMSTHKRYKLTDASNINIVDETNVMGNHIGKGVSTYYMFFERIQEETRNIMIVEPGGRKYKDIVLKPFGDENLFVFKPEESSVYRIAKSEINASYDKSTDTDNKHREKYEFGSYYSVAVGNGISYGGGNIFGMSFTKRMGNVWGFEPQISIGVNSAPNEKTQLTYSVGVNVLYKGLYFSSMYGVNDYYEKQHEEYIDNNGEPHYSYPLVNFQGLSFLFGWKCYFDVNKGLYLDFAAGCRMHGKEQTSFGFDVVSSAWSLGVGFIL